MVDVRARARVLTGSPPSCDLSVGAELEAGLASLGSDCSQGAVRREPPWSPRAAGEAQSRSGRTETAEMKEEEQMEREMEMEMEEK
eukprot:1518150-Pyramimonas_sp.AAC.1